MTTQEKRIEQRNKWREQQSRDIEASKQRMAEETAMDRNHPKFEKVWDMAWDQGHSSRISEVEIHFRDLAAQGSATCQHRMGHYANTGPRTSAEEYKWCGKKATHVANYPKNKPFYLCRKHAKSRCFVSELPNAAMSDWRKP